MTIVEYSVSAAGDDGYWTGSDFITDYFAFGWSDGAQIAFCRFLGITIPAGATITAAYISLYITYKNGTPSPARIYADDSAIPTAPTSAATGNAKTKTTAYVSMGDPAAGDWRNSEELKTVIQELVDSYSYASGAAMQFFVVGQSGSNYSNWMADLYEDPSTHSHAAKLHIEYTAAPSGYTFEVESGSFALSGQNATIQKNVLIQADAGQFALSGLAANIMLNRFIDAASGSYSLTGSDLNILKNSIISGEAGAFNLAGQDASLLVARIMAAQPGSFGLSGQDVSILKNVLMGADPGAFALSGQDAAIQKSTIISAGSGSFGLSGIDANILLSRIISADPGEFILTFLDGDIVITTPGTYVFNCEVAAFTLMGHDAYIQKTTLISAEPGNFAISGQNADILRRLVIAAGSGSYILSGSDASILKSTRFAAGPGSFILSGQDISLIYTPSNVLVLYRGRVIANLGSGKPKGRTVGGV
jgi:hypothetical protein